MPLFVFKKLLCESHLQNRGKPSTFIIFEGQGYDDVPIRGAMLCPFCSFIEHYFDKGGGDFEKALCHKIDIRLG